MTDSPNYTVVAVSDDFLNTYKLKREDIINRGIFYSDQHTDKDDYQNEFYLKDSFTYVINHKKTSKTGPRRLDIPDSDGIYIKKFWEITNVPVLNNLGEVEYIINTAIDITGKIKDNDRLELTKDFEKAYKLFLNAPVIIGILLGDDYTIELANKGLLEIWGRTAEVIGKPLLEVLPEFKEQGFISILDNVRSSGESFYAYEFPIKINRSGTIQEHYFDFVYKPIYEDGSNQKAFGIISVGHEVTAQVLAKRNEKRSEERFRKLFQSMDLGFCVLEMIYDSNNNPVDYRFLETNSVFERQTGLENAIGRTARDLVPNLETHWLQIYSNVARSGESIRFIEESKAMERWFDVYAFPIETEDVNKVALLFTDITENHKIAQTIRESEERFRILADDSPMFVFIIELGHDATVSYWNKTWLEYTGQTYEDAMGSAWDGVIHPDDVSLVTENYTHAYQNKIAYYIPAIRVRRYDGKFRWHAFKGNPRYSSSGEFSGFVGVGFDIHDQKLFEESIRHNEAVLKDTVAERTVELERTIVELKRSNQNLQEFAYAASHDLKEPMRKIQIFSGRLKDNLLNSVSADDKHYFDRISSAILRMNTLIDDLLMYSNTSMVTELNETVDLNKILEFVLEDLELEIEDKNALVYVDSLPSITGQRRQLQQLFQNLIGNSLKYTIPGKAPRVNITVQKIDSNADFLPVSVSTEKTGYFLIEVKDNGPGFEQTDAERIFNVFTRLHGNDAFKGSGVGLAIARKVVENHNGYIWAESQPGFGASFKILLPLK